MRRLAPWALLGLLTAGTAAGIALGVANQPGQTPAQWVANALEATARAATARFTYSHVTSSTNPDLRGTLSGHGVVNFTRGDVRVTEMDRDVTYQGGPLSGLHATPSTEVLDAVGIGGALYQSYDAPANLHWMKLNFPREPRSSLGLADALNASVALSGLDGNDPVVAVHDSGPATVAGVATTKYVVSTAPPALCARQRAVGLTSQQMPSIVWIDKAGRIVRVRAEIRDDLVVPPDPTSQVFTHVPTGKVTVVATLQFSRFGAPVTIAAPSLGRTYERSESVGIAVARGCHPS